jgi:GAF domain
MINLSKYRRWSVSAVITLVLTWIAALAALWNSLLNADVKNEGWAVVFMCLVFFSGILLFYLAFISADQEKIEKIKKEAFDSGRSELIQEVESKKQADQDQQVQDGDIQKVVDAVLASIQSVRSESGLCNKLLASLAREMAFVQGVMYIWNKNESVFNPSGEYALTDRKPQPFKNGETLAGQAVLNKSMTVIYDIPENYFKISSGLGSSAPRYLLIAPVIHNKETIAVLELAAFKRPDESTEKILNTILSEAGNKVNKFITASKS